MIDLVFLTTNDPKSRFIVEYNFKQESWDQKNQIDRYQNDI